MDAHGVDILHGADGDHVAGAVPHHLELDLLPAGDAPLNEHLAHPAEIDAPFGDLLQGGPVVGDAAASAAQGVGGADDDRVADLFGEIHRVLYAFHHQGGDAGLVNGLHAVLKALAVLRLADGLGGGAQQTDAVLLQGAVFVEGHGQVQAGLPPQSGQDGVGPLHLDHLSYGGDVQRLDIHVVSDVLIGHNGGGVGVDQHHLQALLFQGAAGLGSGVVKLGGLADDDGPGAQYQHLFYISIFGHYLAPPIESIKRLNRYSVSLGPALASGWNWVVKQLGRL